MRPASESASQQVVRNNLRVLIAGGGTGGHVNPALAIAREMRDAHSAEVRFVGTARGLETRLVPEAGFPLELVRSGQWKNVALTTKLRTAFDLPVGVLSCLRLIREFKPQVVVGVGGYASGPGMLAAVFKRVLERTLAYEPNAVPGMTNRRLGKWVSAAAVNFAQTAQYFHNAQAERAFCKCARTSSPLVQNPQTRRHACSSPPAATVRWSSMRPCRRSRPICSPASLVSPSCTSPARAISSPRVLPMRPVEPIQPAGASSRSSKTCPPSMLPPTLALAWQQHDRRALRSRARLGPSCRWRNSR